MKNDVQLRASVSSDLKKRLRIEARRQRRTDSALIRILLDDLLPQLPDEDEYEIELTKQEAKALTSQGYLLTPSFLSGTQLTLPGW